MAAITDDRLEIFEGLAAEQPVSLSGLGGATMGAKLTAAAASFLMFQGELFAGKRLLPEFGGAAYVWCTVILFFQLVLIIGYYASRSLAAANPRTRTWILAILGLSGLLTLTPRLPQAAWLPMELRPLAALQPFAGLSVALFTTTPLLHRRQSNRSDYRIYAWSNAGALVGLVSYPLVVEPLTDLWVQNLVWAVGGLAIATMGLAGPSVSSVGEADTGGKSRSRWQWWVLPAVSSALLLATTNRLSYEASAGPLTWALPLAVFLATYVWAFGAPWTAPVGVVALIGLDLFAASRQDSIAQTFPQMLLILAAGGAAMLACNAWLASTRNENTHGFYKATAVGGAIGSAIVVVVIPRITTSPIEFPILACGTLAIAGLWCAHKFIKPVVALAAGAAIVYVSYGGNGTVEHVIARARTLYGCLRVVGDRTGYHELYNNDTLHGAQNPADPESALTYYSPDGGLGTLIRETQGQDASISMGVVGLGTATINWFLRPEDLITYYEIDPKVEELSTEYFTYARSGHTWVVLGDARKSLEKQIAQQYDIIVLDAFSGDAIPMHLLTKEAGAVYRRHLKSTGAVVVHISNRYVDLQPVAMGLAKNMGMAPELAEDYWASWVILRPGPFKPLGNVIEWTDQKSSIVPILDVSLPKYHGVRPLLRGAWDFLKVLVPLPARKDADG